MAMTVTLDTVENSQWEEQGTFQRISRGVMVQEIDPLLLASDPSAMWKARNAIMAVAGGTFPNTQAVLTKIVLRGYATNGVVGQCIYETFQGLQTSTYIIRRTSYVIRVETNMIPGTRQPIGCRWVDPNWNGQGVQARVPFDYVNMAFMLPVQAIAVSGLVYGQPTTNFSNVVGFVNNNLWYGLPKGYWMLTKYEDAISKYSGYYTYEAQASAKNYEDWSQTGILRSRQTGRYVKVLDSTINTMNNLPYQYGIIFPTNSTDEKLGIVRAGGNPVANFSTIFGF